MSLWACSYYAVFLLEGKETSQLLFLVKASWHAPLICPLNERKKKEGKLESIENRVQRVAELESGTGIEDSDLRLHLCHYVNISSGLSWLNWLSRECFLVWMELEEHYWQLVTVEEKEIMGPYCTLELSKLSCTVHRNKINFISQEKPSSTSQVDIFRFQTVLKTVCWDS